MVSHFWAQYNVFHTRSQFGGVILSSKRPGLQGFDVCRFLRYLQIFQDDVTCDMSNFFLKKMAKNACLRQVHSPLFHNFYFIRHIHE